MQGAKELLDRIVNEAEVSGKFIKQITDAAKGLDK